MHRDSSPSFVAALVTAKCWSARDNLCTSHHDGALSRPLRKDAGTVTPCVSQGTWGFVYPLAWEEKTTGHGRSTRQNMEEKKKDKGEHKEGNLAEMTRKAFMNFMQFIFAIIYLEICQKYIFLFICILLNLNTFIFLWPLKLLLTNNPLPWIAAVILTVSQTKCMWGNPLKAQTCWSNSIRDLIRWMSSQTSVALRVLQNYIFL